MAFAEEDVAEGGLEAHRFPAVARHTPWSFSLGILRLSCWWIRQV